MANGGGNSAGLAVVIGLPIALVAGLLGFTVISDESQPGCNPTGGAAEGVAVSAEIQGLAPVAGYDAEQLANAAAIIQAGSALDMGVRDQTIAVMTAMGESGLRVLDHGDTAGPDSRGLFQQRDNGAWGTLAERMDPTASATSFYRALAKVSDRDALDPTIAAHRVQANQNPFHYESHWPAAVRVVQALSGTDSGSDFELVSDTVGACTSLPGVPAEVNAAGWAPPVTTGYISSPFGWRQDPFTNKQKFHPGSDFAAACGTPIYAINDGVVIHAGGPAFYMTGGVVAIDHGGNLISRAGHMRPADITVRVGQKVQGGDVIGLIGNEGNSTGCHTHFEISVGGSNVDSAAYLRQAGVTLPDAR
jgi:murein DD-endopeptidase MepM/ murein hydrolase activator NlpD